MAEGSKCANTNSLMFDKVMAKTESGEGHMHKVCNLHTKQTQVRKAMVGVYEYQYGTGIGRRFSGLLIWDMSKN